MYSDRARPRLPIDRYGSAQHPVCQRGLWRRGLARERISSAIDMSSAAVIFASGTASSR
jgi:hypothetical protein